MSHHQSVAAQATLVTVVNFVLAVSSDWHPALVFTTGIGAGVTGLMWLLVWKWRL